MYVTQHAEERLASRFPHGLASRVAALLDGIRGEPGTVAYIVCNVPGPTSAPVVTGEWWHDSNGDILVAVAHDGSVETVFYRRSTQDMSAEFFGARKVVDLRVEPVFTGGA